MENKTLWIVVAIIAIAVYFYLKKCKNENMTSSSQVAVESVSSSNKLNMIPVNISSKTVSYDPYHGMTLKQKMMSEIPRITRQLHDKFQNSLTGITEEKINNMLIQLVNGGFDILDRNILDNMMVRVFPQINAQQGKFNVLCGSTQCVNTDTLLNKINAEGFISMMHPGTPIEPEGIYDGMDDMSETQPMSA